MSTVSPSTRPSVRLVRVLCLLALAVAAASWATIPAFGQDLGSARLQIAGTHLGISPQSQTVPLDTSTEILTEIEGYDPSLGVLPADLRVVGDLVGPGINGVLRLEAFPNEPLRVPALRLEGQYYVEDIRLVQGDELLAYAEPRTAAVLATKILLTKVSTRALTRDEIRSYGIVIDDDSRQAINLSFAFGIKGREIQYSMPVVFQHYGVEEWGKPGLILPAIEQSGTLGPGERFTPVRPTPFKVEIEREEVEPIEPKGCDPRSGCRQLHPSNPPMVGVVFFPTEMSRLHDFFSVLLMVQNGAPDGDILSVHDLTAKVKLPSGLRQAETEPPTPLGVPVPVRVPGADGEVGTSDDLTILVAQATGQAEFLVEGLREGTHIVEFEMEGRLEGMPTGPKRISGKAQGAVVVRDPTLTATITHPTTIRANETYSTYFTITNLGNAPVNDIELAISPSGLAGTQLAAGEVPTKPMGSLLPGESSTIEFRMAALMAGSVIATSTRAGSGISPRFEFGVSVANDIPLSPESLALPKSIDTLPEELTRPSIGLLGLGLSLAQAPWEVLRGRPQVTMEEVNERAYRLVQAARHHSLGEGLFEATAIFATEWAGGRDQSWEWDHLRRTTDRALELSEAVGAILAVEEPDPAVALDRFAATTHDFNSWLALAENSEIEVASRVSGKVSSGFLDQAVRDLPFAELLPLDGGELAVLTVPETEGHRVTVRRDASGGADLTVILPRDTAGNLRKVTWFGVSMDAGGSAWVDVVDDGTSLDLHVDGNADGVADQVIPGSESVVAARPFGIVAARQNHDTDPSGHVVEILFNADVDLRSLIPSDPDRFQVDGRVSNGGMTIAEVNVGGGLMGDPEIVNPFKGMANPRVIQVVFDNPLGPFETHEVTVSDLRSAGGDDLPTTTEPIVLTVDQPGIRLEGQVFDSYGQPMPYAEVKLRQWDLRGIVGRTAECVKHAVAGTRADAEGRYSFSYVRQTACSSNFEVEAKDPLEPRFGVVEDRVRFVNQTQQLDVRMHGRAVVEGRVLYEDGSPPAGLQVTALNRVFDEGRIAWTDAQGYYRMAEVVVGTVQLTAWDELGNRTYQTIEVPTAGARIEKNLTILRRPEENATTGIVRGTIVDDATGEPEALAHVMLYVDGFEIGHLQTEFDGTFDFGVVPTGIAELFAYDAVTALQGAQFFFELDPDEVEDIELRLRSDLGSVEGYVTRVSPAGVEEAAEGIVVWVDGEPFHTTTDAQGYYRLDEVPAGLRRVSAADLEARVSISGGVTITTAATPARRDLRFEQEYSLHSDLRGVVLGVDGQPVAGAAVSLAGGYNSTQSFHNRLADASGRFSFPDLDPGVYYVHAMAGSAGAIQTGEIRFPGDVDDIVVQLNERTIQGRTFFVDQDGYEVPVVSMIQFHRVLPIPLWGVVALTADWGEVITEADGTFSIPSVDGPFRLRAVNAFHGTVSADGVLDQFTPEIELEFKQNSTLTGTVFLEDGLTPAVGAEVKLQGGLIQDFTVHTDDEGRFLFDLLPPSTYQITTTLDQGFIFRTERVWAQIRDHGEVLDIEVTLPMQGQVTGWVESADGDRVGNAIVELRERGFPWRKILQTTDVEGNYTFDNIFVGTVSLDARAPELGGLGGKTVEELTDEGQEVLSVITLEGVGRVEGRVLSPETNDVVASARVRLLKGTSFFDSASSGVDGTFSFEMLPLGQYQFAVFDPTTGRHGEGGWFEITGHGQVAEVEIVLEVRGAVDGHLYSPPENVGVPGVPVQLYSKGIKWFKVWSSTDAEGYFEFGGIPEGPFDLFARTDRRTAKASGEIEYEDQVVTRDLYLDRLGKIGGIVFGPVQQDGSRGEQVEELNVVLRQGGGELIAASSDNPFTFDNLLPGQYTVIATSTDGRRRVEQSGLRIRDGEEYDVELVYRAEGSFDITVESSQGNPVAGADVEVSNYYSWHNLAPANFLRSSQAFEGQTDAQGEIRFDGGRQGFATIRATEPLTGLQGSARVDLTYEGEVAQAVVTLQPSGTIRGVVLLSDGVTPAVGAQVSLVIGNKNWEFAFADETGAFSFESIPLQSYELFAQQADSGPGSISVLGSLDADQQIDEWPLVLDDADPYVVEVTPSEMVRDVPVTTSITVRFSEPVLPCTSCGGFFELRLLTGGGGWLNYSVTWSEQDTVATLTPSQPLQSSSTYRIQVFDSIRDQARRKLATTVVTGFVTADVIAPKVVDFQPVPGSVQVPIDTGIRIMFSEPVVLDTLSGAFQVTDLETGSPVTVTTTPRLDARGVTLTALPDFQPDQTIEVQITGVADGSGNVMDPFVATFWTVDQTSPVVAWQQPSANQAFTAGDDVVMRADVTDNRGVEAVWFEIGPWTSVELTQPPYETNLPAPAVAVAGDHEIRVHARDIFGNLQTSARTIWIEPLDNTVPPELVQGCPAPLDFVAPGETIAVDFEASDDLDLASAWLEVDGVEMGRQALVWSQGATLSFPWTPPADAVPGQSFELVLAVADFADNVTTQTFTVAVPDTLPLAAGAALEGTDLFLGQGAHVFDADLMPTRLVLLQGASLTQTPGTALAAAGEVRIQCGAGAQLTDVTAVGLFVERRATLSPIQTETLFIDADTVVVEDEASIDGVGLGYPGFRNGITEPTGPDWIPRAQLGASHGGLGGHDPDTDLVDAHPAYGSLYVPTLPGAGGDGWWPQGLAGGAAIDLRATTLQVDGTMRADGASGPNAYHAGAGGAILIDVGTLGGAGRISANGGATTSCNASGGGGRVAIRAQSFVDFDPDLQVEAQGRLGDCNEHWIGARSSGPGTVLVETSGSVYGALRIENGLTADGTPFQGFGTVLPALGTGSISATQVEGGDLWIFSAQTFRPKWLGTRVELLDASGNLLGSYRVVAVDGTRLRLAGAGSVGGAMSFRGVYRFDSVSITGARFVATDPIYVDGEIEIGPATEIDAPVTSAGLKILAGSDFVISGPIQVTGDLVIEAGAVVRPAGAVPVDLEVGGRLVIEEGVVLDASGLGYTTSEKAPEGIDQPTSNAGGSHGGVGNAQNESDRGEVYDSVYLPHQKGGVGKHGAGGGVILIDAGEVVLDGALRANGIVGGGYNDSGAAGGTVRITAGGLSGIGSIEANGVTGTFGSGGGGRVALWVDDLTGFDPKQQVQVYGGVGYDGAAGTLFLKDSSATYGDLVIDSGPSTASGRPPATELPALGSGSVSVANAVGPDLWIDLGGTVMPRWLGAWIELRGGTSELLGTYRVGALGTSTVRLEGAGSQAAAAASYRGVYRFDSIETFGRAWIAGQDQIEVSDLTIEGEVEVTSPLEAQRIRFGPTAVVRPVAGVQSIEIRATESIVIDQGAVISAYGAGYKGLDSGGEAPPDIEGSGYGAGGSHGGRGVGSAAGPVFDSVYRPTLAGGGGGRNSWWSADGGGIVVLAAPQVVLDGQIDARGARSYVGINGAGGTVRIESQALSGSGTIEAGTPMDSTLGGGGRVALLVDDLSGYDYRALVDVVGSDYFLPAGATGTLFVRSAASTYGTLILDSRRFDARDPDSGLVQAHPTELPVLGSGVPVSVVADGADLLLDLGTRALERWLDAWIILRAADGSELVTAQVVELDGQVLRIADAGSVAAQVATWDGRYLFDRVELRGGTGIASSEIYADTVWVDGIVTVGGVLAAGDLTLTDGTLVQARDFEPLALDIDRTLVIPAGAALDASGRGFDGVDPAPPNVGWTSGERSSHGGLGAQSAGGEIYGSVYRPRFSGARVSATGNRGGGRVEIRAGDILLGGTIAATGQNWSAGGSVWVEADSLAGAGSIRADGGTDGGGGGRVGLQVGDLTGFDAATQVSAVGPRWAYYNIPAGAGTVYVFDGGSVYGTLYMDNARPGVGESDMRKTPLPQIGSGQIGLVEPDTDDPASAWIEPVDPGMPFDLGVEGMWLRVGGVDYRVLAEDGSRRRILIEGASGSLQVGDAYEGVHKFDQVYVADGASLLIDDTSEVGAWFVEDDARAEAATLAITVSIPALPPALEGTSWDLAATFDDQSPGQVHTATIDWGDGTVESGLVTDGDPGSVGGSHTWTQDGTYQITVCVQHVETAREGCASVQAQVDNAPPVPVVDGAEPLDFSTWVSEDHPNGSPGNWSVSADGTVVTQIGGTTASSFFHGGGSVFGWRFEGGIRPPNDDDFFGLALGFNSGDTETRPETDYFLLQWKGNAESGSGVGLKLYRIRGAADMWPVEGDDLRTLVAQAATLGTSRWIYGTTYSFRIEVTPYRLKVWVDDLLEFDLEVEFTDGEFAFWTYAQRASFSDFVRSPVVDEGDALAWGGTFTDLGIQDVHQATVDWGDGSPIEEATVAQSIGGGEFVLPPHAFPESGSYSVVVCVDDTSSAGDTEGCTTWTTDVGDRPARLTLPQNLQIEANDTTPVVIADFTDGSADVHTATIDWGDGAGPSVATVEVVSPGVSRVLGSRSMNVGQYSIVVCVSDDDGATGCTEGMLDVFGSGGPAIFQGAPTVVGAEGSTAVLDASFTDPDAGDVHTATVDWGDGTIEPAQVDQDADHVAAQHLYVESGSYDVTVCVTDLASLTACQTTQISITNLGAVVDVAALTGLAEGAPIDVTLPFADPGVLDTHTAATVDWGDGAGAQAVTELVSGADGQGTIRIVTTYTDSGPFTIDLCVTDDEGGVGCTQAAVNVANVAPVVTGAAEQTTSGGAQLELATYTDAGVADTHVASVDWGDGTAVEAATVEVTGGGAGRVLAGHVYATAGTYAPQICVTDDDGAQSCSPTSLVEPDVTPPTVSVTGVAAIYRAGQTLTASIATEDEIGVERVEVTFDGSTTTLNGPGPNFTFSTVVDPTLTVARSTSLDVVAYDYEGHVSLVDVTAVDLVLDQPAQLTVSLSPGATVQTGAPFTVTADMSDDVRIATVAFSVTGGYSDGAQYSVQTAVASRTWQSTVPAYLSGGDTMTLSVDVTDSFGNVTQHQQVLTVAGDSDPPTLTIDVTPVAAGDTYGVGELVSITASAVDDVEVTSFSVTLDGQTVSGASPLFLSWTTPAVASTTGFVVHAEATDPQGNVGTLDRTLYVQPASNPNAPTAEFTCPTTGAVLPPSLVVALQVTAADDEGVVQVEFYRNAEATPFATVVPDTGTPTTFDASTTDTLPASTGAEQQVTYRAVSYDAAFNSTEQQIVVRVLDAVDLDAAGGNDWAALATQVAVLRTGVLEVDQPRTLAGLVVLDGASLTHPQSAPGAETSLDLTVNGPVYVACGGALDATAKGYSGNQTYPGESLPGSNGGGSHIGQGGYNPGTTYGSVTRPAESGGGAQHTYSSNLGGGVVRIQAETLVVDGSVAADGAPGTDNSFRGGAGGSVWITSTGSVSGGGEITARGATVVNSGVGDGGGGAVAVEYGAASTELPQIAVHGGAKNHTGGPGSVFLRAPGQTYGTLRIDSGTVDATRPTHLPALGEGVAQSGSSGAVLVTDLPSVQPYFEGHWVEVYDGATSAFEGYFPIESISGSTLTLGTHGAMSPQVDPGDLWQGAYYFDSVSYRGGSFELQSEDPIRVVGEVEIDGQITTDWIEGGSLVVRADATLKGSATTDPASPKPLEIDLTGDLVLEAGASIDASGLGFGPHTTYPGEQKPGNGNGGSHIGVGGWYSGLDGSTYGSVYTPREPGGGGDNSTYGKPGGGVVRILAQDLVLQGSDSVIRANGIDQNNGWSRGGAGGSIWISLSGQLSGNGLIEARGGLSGTNQVGSGGGGAIAIEHQGITGAIADRMLASGGSNNTEGGPGSLYLLGPTSTYGDLVIDAGTVPDGITELPALGSGTAGAGSSGNSLETGLGSIQPYFVGHWVEIYDSATGALRGAWRVVSISGGTVTLASGAIVQPGDGWQGVYRFDNVTLGGEIELLSEDPIRTSGVQEIDGAVELERISGSDLILRAGALVKHPPTTDPANPKSLEIDLTGSLVLEAGASIDVSGLGLGPHTTYPGEQNPGNGNGGSHIGVGGWYSGLDGSTYGSVYTPREPGGGGDNSTYGKPGGGVVRILAQDLVLQGSDSVIRANGIDQNNGWSRGGAGGSIWISLSGQLSGNGLIEARGGLSGTNQVGSGGGGAISIEHQGITGAIADRMLASGGSNNTEGGPGSLYLFGPVSTYGDLVVDAGTVPDGVTELPSLGAGIAEITSGADVLDTDLPAAVQPYFVGHWVEIYDAATGDLEGTYRIGEILGDGTVVRLEANGVDVPAVDPGDLWQGVYLFDQVYLLGDGLTFESDDPVIATDTEWIGGTVTTDRIFGQNLVVTTGSVLEHPLTNDGSGSLDIQLTGDLAIESGAEIDVSALGFPASTTYSGATGAGSYGGGSHLGLGGYAPGTSYGSVCFPWEHGAGGQSGSRGGGRARILADDLIFGDATSALRANGETGTASLTRGGAGGSLWIELSGTISGDGVIEASGGRSGNTSHGSGGGGAIAIRHQGSSGTVLSSLTARSGDQTVFGGAGSIFLHGPTSTDGDLLVDGGGLVGRDTVLPALGSGTAQTGSAGDTLITAQASIPGYFLGHRVELATSTGTVKGVFPVLDIVGGTTLILGDDGAVVPSVAEGDQWRGVYLFDDVTVQGGATLQSADGLFEAGVEITP